MTSPSWEALGMSWDRAVGTNWGNLNNRICVKEIGVIKHEN